MVILAQGIGPSKSVCHISEQTDKFKGLVQEWDLLQFSCISEAQKKHVLYSYITEHMKLQITDQYF